MWQKIATQVQKYSTKGIVTASSVRARVALKRGELMEKLGLTQILKKKNISLEDKINRKLRVTSIKYFYDCSL